MKKTLLASLLAAAALPVFAAGSADLKVIGKITPVACDVSFNGGDVIDFGTMSARDLDKNRHTSLGMKHTTLHITCDAPAQVAFTVTDNREGSSSIPNDVMFPVFGLGLAGDAKIGYYFMRPVGAAMVDGVAAPYHMHRKIGETRWSNVAGWRFGDIYERSWGSQDVGVMEGQAIAVPFSVNVLIAPTKDLDLTKEITLDGSATFTLKYL